MKILFRFVTRNIKKGSIKEDFKLVSYTGDKNHINLLFWTCVIGSLISFWLVVLLDPLFPTINFWGLFYATTDFILLPVLIYLLFKIWQFYYRQRNKPSKIAEKLLYFIKANKLYETEMIEKKDSENNIERVKVVTNSAVFGFCEDEETLIVRGYKNADVFNDKISSLDTGLSALVGSTVYNKVDKISYCDYYFRKKQDERIVMESNQEIAHNDSVYIPFNSNLIWNVLKQPHLLLAGVTGGGKTTFLNYLIIEMKKMRAAVYICDPKRSDLSSIQHFWGKEYVASETNNIARLTREVKEQMMERFAIYKENPESFVYGASYVDYGLSPIFLVFDELGAFRAGADKKTFAETMSNLTELVLKGREMGVFVILSTQQPNASNIPTELRDNLSVRIALGNMSNEAYSSVLIDMSGQACRQYEEYMSRVDGWHWYKFVSVILEMQGKVSRIDLALDIFDDSTPSVKVLQDYVKRGQLSTKSHKFIEINSGRILDGKLTGFTLYIGASPQILRIYDKKQERRDNADEVVNVEKWVRWELELTGNKAMQVALQISNGKPFNTIVKGILSAHYCFKTQPKSVSDLHNKNRLPTMRWWQKFVDGIEAIPLKVKREKLTLKKKKNWVENATVKSISMLYESFRRVYGEKYAELYLKELIHMGKEKITESDQTLIEQRVLELMSEDEY